MRRPHPFACVVLGIRGAAVFLLAALLIADFIFNIAYLAVKGCHFALY